MSDHTLTVCIPTYNRGQKVRVLLERLRAQINAQGLHAQVAILISDNASPDDTAEVCAAAQAVNDGVFITVQRQTENIGLSANVEWVAANATSPFIWITSDDDIPKPDALQQILDTVGQHDPDICYFNFDQPHGADHHLAGSDTAFEVITDSAKQFAMVNQSRKITAWVLRQSAVAAGAGEYRTEHSKHFYWGVLTIPISILGAVASPTLVLCKAVLASSDRDFDHWGHPPMQWRAEAGIWQHPIVERNDPERFANAAADMLVSWLSFVWLWRTGRLEVPKELHRAYLDSLPSLGEGRRLLRGWPRVRTRFTLLKLTGRWGPRLAYAAARLLRGVTGKSA